MLEMQQVRRGAAGEEVEKEAGSEPVPGPGLEHELGDLVGVTCGRRGGTVLLGDER